MTIAKCVTICVDCEYYKPERGGSEVQSAIPARCLFNAHLVERRNFVTGEIWREYQSRPLECCVKNDIGDCSDYAPKVTP